MKAFILPTVFTAIDRVTSTVNKINKSVASVSNTARNVSRNFAVAGAIIMAPLVVAANEAIKFEDKMADVAKTTGLSGAGLEKFGGDLLDMSTNTRTSIDDLLKIGEIGGQFGIAQKDLLGFTDSVNKFNVALGADFSGGVEEAVAQVSSIYGLFKQTKDLKVDDAIIKIGSSINELGAQGSGTSANIADFTVRMGALPGAIKPAMTDIAALGTFFEENGIKSEIASGGLTNFFLVAGRNLPGFAKQMGMSSEQARILFAQNPTAFAKRFASSLQGMSGEQLAIKLKHLKIGTQETIKVLGALSTGTERVTALQKISGDAFAAGTSLQTEYDKKNNTSAANIKKLQNQVKAFTIEIGTHLLPILSELIKEVSPWIKSSIAWLKNNKELVKTILKVTLAVAAFVFAVSAVAAVVAAVSKAIILLNTVMYLLAANPVVLGLLVVIAIIALVIAAIYLLYKGIEMIIKKWDEWGAAAVAVMGLFMPPLALIISMCMSLYNNWDMIRNAFKDEGIVAGIMAIGATILDAILYPLQQVLEIIASISGSSFISDQAESLKGFRSELGLHNPAAKEEIGTLGTAPNPAVERNEMMVQRMEKTMNNRIALDINDPNGRTKVRENTGGIPIRTTSTHKFGTTE